MLICFEMWWVALWWCTSLYIMSRRGVSVCVILRYVVI